MNLALTVNCWSDEDLLFASQFGVTHIMAEASIPHGRMWDRHALAAIRNRATKANSTFSGLADLPQQYSISSYLQQIQRNEITAEERLDGVCAFVTSAGATGIPMIVCDCDIPGTSESVVVPEGRAGALIHKYERPESTGVANKTALWQHLTRWLQRVVPVAEKAQVKLAFGTRHISSMGWLDSIETMQHLIAVVPSHYAGFNFRHSVIAQTLGNDTFTAIRHFNAQKKIFMVEVGNLRSHLSHVVEAFLDESISEDMPDVADMLRTLQVYHAAGYEGTVQPAPPPGLVGDTTWGHKGQAFNLGYIRALLQVVERVR